MNGTREPEANHDPVESSPHSGRPVGSWALILLSLIGLVMLFFNKMAFSNLILARGDTFLYFYPYWTAAAEALRSGHVPLWNPDLFMGAPFLANSQVGYFYPLNWPVWLLLPTPYAVSASILLHLTIGGCGAYLAARRTMALGRAAALFAAALFALGGYLTAQVEHINQLQGLAWLPWYFAVLSPLVNAGNPSRNWRVFLGMILAIGALFTLQLFAGHTQTAFISGVSVTLWLIIHALMELAGFLKPKNSVGLLRMVMVMGAGVGLAIILSAAQLLPTLELTGQSARQSGLSLNEVLSFSWHPLHLTRALLPGYGQALFTEYIAFLPLTALALAFIGAWVWRKNPAVLPWLALVIITFVLALGRFTPVYYVLGRLPGFDLFRAPARWLAVATLGVALLAGCGWQRLHLYTIAAWPTEAGKIGARRVLVQPLVAAAVSITLLILWGFIAGWVARYIPVDAAAPYERPTPLAMLGWLIEFALAALLLWVILTGPDDRARHATFELIVLTLAVLWLGSRGLPYNRLTTPEAYFDLRPPQSRLGALAACAIPDRLCANPPDRFLSLSDILFDPGDLAEIESIYADQLDPAAGYDYVIAVKQKEVISPNLSMIAGLPAIDGFDGGILPLKAYSELMKLILPEGSATTDGRLREYLAAAPDSRWLSLFNGRYLITDKTGDVWREGVFFDRQHPAFIGDEEVRVADVPAFEATELWLIVEGTPPPVEITTASGETWQLSTELLKSPDLYRAIYPEPVVAAEIGLLPCPVGVTDCSISALTLVDKRDGAFQPLVLSPYRLIFSGDVKIYENLEAQPRAFWIYDWQWAQDVAAAIEAMRVPNFDPGKTAVVIGEDTVGSSPSGGSGTIEILNYAPESISLRASSDSDGLLVLTDAFYPGWEATVDGLPTTIRQVDGLFRGVFLSAGVHQVEFFFQPRSYRLGIILSAAGLGIVFIAVMALVAGRRQRRQIVR